MTDKETAPMGNAEAKPDTPRARARAPRADWDAFLAALREVPSVKRACKAAGVSRQSAYERREKHPAFAAAWKEAEQDAVDDLVFSVWTRARNGWKSLDPEVDRPSDDLAKFLLRSHRPELYALSIQVKGEKTLAELRAMSDEDLDALGARMGWKPAE